MSCKPSPARSTILSVSLSRPRPAEKPSRLSQGWNRFGTDARTSRASGEKLYRRGTCDSPNEPGLLPSSPGRWLLGKSARLSESRYACGKSIKAMSYQRLRGKKKSVWQPEVPTSHDANAAEQIDATPTDKRVYGEAERPKRSPRTSPFACSTAESRIAKIRDQPIAFAGKHLEQFDGWTSRPGDDCPDDDALAGG